MFERRGIEMAELKAALRHRRGEDSGSGDDDPGLPRSPPTSPTTLDVLTHGLKGGSSRATQSSCSDGSLLSMGSSENDEDSLGAASHHSSRASLLEGRHQVVDGAKMATEKAEEKSKKGNKETKKEGKDDPKWKMKRRRRNDPKRLTFVSDAIIVGRDPDPGDDQQDESDHEPVAGAVRLSHQAALHKIAVRPKRTHGAPRARRATQIGGQISLPDVIEEANSRHPSGLRPAAPQPAPAPAPVPALAPTSSTPTPPTPDYDEVVENGVDGREQQGVPEERKEERREEPLFQRLFGSTSKRAGRRQSRGSGEESRENSVSPLRRGAEQRASRDRRHDASGPRFPLIGSAGPKPRQEPSHPLPPSGRPRDPSKERGIRDFPPSAQQSPEDAPLALGPPGAGRSQGVRKAKSFREEQTPVHQEAVRRKASASQAGTEEQTGAVPSKTSRLSASLESIDGNDNRKSLVRAAAAATPPAGASASPQRSSTESLTTTPLPGVFIRPHPQAARQRAQPHPSPPETTSGPFSLDSCLGFQPREAEEHLRKASSVDQVSYVSEVLPTTHRDLLKDHASREQLRKEQAIREQGMKEHAIREQAIKEQAFKEQTIKEQVMREQATKEQHVKEHHMKEQHFLEQHMNEQLIKEQFFREQHTKELHFKELHFKEQVREHLTKQQHHLQGTSTHRAGETKPPSVPLAAKQALLDTLVESIRPDRKSDAGKATPRRSLGQTQQPQALHKEEPPPVFAQPVPQHESGEGEHEQAAPRRPLRREPSVKCLPVVPCDPDGAVVPEFMRIQLNRVENKGQSVIYDTEQEKGDRKEEDVPLRREAAAPSSDLKVKETQVLEQPVETHTPLKKEVVAPSAAASTRESLVRRTSVQGPRGILRDTSPSAGVPEGCGIEPSMEAATTESSMERVQPRRSLIVDRLPLATDRTTTATSSPSAASSRDQPELFKVFARRSFKIKEPEKELFEAANVDETGFEASSEVSEMTVSSGRPPSTSPLLAVSYTPATELVQKIGINAISFNRKSVGNPALSFIPPPTSASSESPAGLQGHARPQAAPASTSHTPSTTITMTTTTTTTTITTTTTTTATITTTTATTTTPEGSTPSATSQTGIYSKILSGRVSGGSESSSGNESESSTSSPMLTRALAAPSAKPSVSSRPGSALVWPPRPQAAPEDLATAAPPHPTMAQQDTPSRRSMEGVEAPRETVESVVEVVVSPLDIGAARRRFMSASFTQERLPGPLPSTVLGTSPTGLASSPSPPAPTPSPPAPSNPAPTTSTSSITSAILSRAASTATAPTHSPTPSFTITVRTQPPPALSSDAPQQPAVATSSPVTDLGKGSDSGPSQQSTDDWRVLVRQRREGRLKQTKTPDSEEMIIETRPPVSRNSKVLEMASNFQKLQVA